LSDDEFMLFGRGTFWVDYIRRHGDYNVTSAADDWFNFQVQGPTFWRSSRSLEAIAAGRQVHAFGRDRDRRLQDARAAAGNVGRDRLRTAGTTEQAAAVYDAIVAAGQEFGLRRIGGRAIFINHLEACFPTIVTDYMPAIFGEDMKEYQD